LAEALGSEDVVILDIRKADRFESGHIPSSQLVTRGDYSGGDIPGVSFEADALQEMLRVRGVNQDSTVVLLGDGGPEPYRLWWTLSQVAGFETRVLDGGLDGWKAIGELLAEGTGVVAQYGDVELSEGIGRNLMWADVAAVQESYPELQFLDTRDEWEYNGTPAPEDSKHAGLAHHPKSERAGRIPGAEHARWTDVFEINDTGVPVLRSPEDVLAQVRAANIDPSAPLVTYCQSGTRSAAIFYGLVQAGVSTDTLWNYDGSWAEYSRLSLDPEGAVESDGAADVDDSEAI
jgi:thiosulfate/3-mercaptopyruvate sulfurtransferase